jgi:hypothetical protein
MHACVVAGLFAFAASIFFGVIYLPWLNLLARADEGTSEIETLLLTASTDKISLLEAEKLERKSQKESCCQSSPGLKMIHNSAFAVALLTLCLGVVGAFFYKAEPEKRPQETKRYVVSQSAVHRTNHGIEAHTFLLDPVTGTTWQMVCQNSDRVAFREIQRMDAAAWCKSSRRPDCSLAHPADIFASGRAVAIFATPGTQLHRTPGDSTCFCRPDSGWPGLFASMFPPTTRWQATP